MKSIRMKYPCGTEIEAKAFSIFTLLFAWWGLSENDSKLKCPLHGKDCKIPISTQKGISK